jgi:molybdate transport system ATP-binding protein
VALARALAREPDVLLLDEPFSAVDQVTRRKLRLEMAQLTRHLNIPIVLVTHDLDEACMLADRMCVLHAGRTLQEGVPLEVMERPKDATVARLIDIRNLFEADVIEQRPEQGITRLRWGEHLLDAEFHSQFAVGVRLCWCIPPAAVLLHQRVRPSRGERENPLWGRITDVVTLGGITTLILQLERTPNARLNMDLSPHVVQRNGLMVGERIGVSLLKEAIHLMPWQALTLVDPN